MSNNPEEDEPGYLSEALRNSPEMAKLLAADGSIPVKPVKPRASEAIPIPIPIPMPGNNTPPSQPVPKPSSVFDEEESGYINVGHISIEQVMNGDPKQFMQYDDLVISTVKKIQDILMKEQVKIDEDRNDPFLKDKLITRIDSEAFGILSATANLKGDIKAIVIASIVNELVGLGPLEPLWQDVNITEVIANGPNDIYVERFGKLLRAKGVRFRSAEHLEEICNRIVAGLGRKFDIKFPTVDARLSDGSRVNAVHTSLASKGPFLTIRRFPQATRSLVDLVDLKSMNEEMARNLAWLISNKATTLVVGSTGSGKLIPMWTPIPTPSGWTTMGELNIGDEIFGRDGKICNVTFVSDVDPTPNLYKIKLSDGQEVIADANHQWVVSDFDDRRRPRSDKREASLVRYRDRILLGKEMQKSIQSITEELVTAKELWNNLRHLDGMPWKDRNSLWHALEDSKCPSTVSQTRSIVTRKERIIPQEVRHFNIHQVSEVLIAQSLKGIGKFKTNSLVFQSRLSAMEIVKKRVSDDSEASLTSILVMMKETKLPIGNLPVTSLYPLVRKMHIPYSLVIENKKHNTNLNTIQYTKNSFYNPTTAINYLSERLLSLYSEEPSLEPDEQVITTQSMVNRGLFLEQGHSRFAISIPEAIDLPYRDLPVDPYTLGAWLGDGTTSSGGITGLDMQIFERIESVGYNMTHSKKEEKRHYILGLTKGLREIGCFSDKRIPLDYLRSSKEQRLALLQGLMDTDGSIAKRGSCEISLNKADLAQDVLSLIRSLGIKASVSTDPSVYMATDKITGEKYRKVTGTRNRIKFTTTLPIFHLSRKTLRLPSALRETNRWNYIIDIEPVTTEPGRCIQVDSPDSTYLIKDFIPTHNTTLLNALSAAIPRDERIITIEDSLELRLNASSHVAALEARPPDASGGNAVTIKDLVKNALRMRPDRIIVGEVRGAEALDMLQACNTGHEGSMSTLHANGPNEAIMRLAVMIAQGGEMPSEKVDWLVGSALDLMIQIRRYKDGSRRISGIYEVPNIADLAPGESMKTVPLWEWKMTGKDPEGRFLGDYQKRENVSQELSDRLGLEFEPLFTWEEVKKMCLN